MNFSDTFKFETAKLADGATIEADAFEPEAEVFIVTEDEKVPLPIGEYTLETGEILTVEVDGIISSFVIPEAVEEVEKTEELETETPAAEVKTAKKVIESVSKETIFSAEDKKVLEEKIEALELELTAVKKKAEKEVEPVIEEVKLETQKVVHSPEKEVENNSQKIKTANTVQSRILAQYN